MPNRRYSPQAFGEFLGREITIELQRFSDGEVDREEVQRVIQKRLEAVMNTIAAKQSQNPNEQKLKKKAK